MPAETEELLEWASRKMGVRFRDPGERRQTALASLIDSGFAPEADTVRAISTLLHYEPGEPLTAPFLAPKDLQEIKRDCQREEVVAELQTLPDLPLDQRTAVYHQLRQKAAGDPWLLQRVDRAAALIDSQVCHIESDDPLRLLVLLPSEAVLKRPAPPPPPDPFEFLQFENIRSSPLTESRLKSPGILVLIIVAIIAIMLLVEMITNEYISRKSNPGNAYPRSMHYNQLSSPPLQNDVTPLFHPFDVHANDQLDGAPEQSSGIEARTNSHRLNPDDLKRLQDLLKQKSSRSSNPRRKPGALSPLIHDLTPSP